MNCQFWTGIEVDGGAREKGGINYGPGIVIAVATDVTQTKVSMQLNDDDFS